VVVRPRYDFEDAALAAASETYRLLDGAYGPDVVFWEVLEVNNRVRNVGGYLATLINEVGVDGYLAMREQIIAGIDPKK
jgi:hypothetical protein